MSAPKVVTTTTSRVPRNCAVCMGTGIRQFNPALALPCPACEGKGWLMTTETTTTTSFKVGES